MSRQIKWNTYKLESVAQLISGRTPEREQKEYYADEGTPWVKIENLDLGFITQTAEYLSEKGREKVNLVPKNSVLFSIVGTVGKVGIAGKELATNQQIVSFIFDEEKVLPMYGYYCLRYHADKIRRLSDQTTMALISRKTLGQYRIHVPQDLQRQEKIVKTLEMFESYARKKEDLRKQMDRYEQILFWKMFHQEIRFHETLLLKECLREPIGLGVSKEEEPEGEAAFIRANDFQKPYLCRNVLADQDIEFDKKYHLQEGDVLLRNGRLFLAEKQQNPLYIERNILCIRTKHNQLLPEVLYGWLNLPDIAQTLYTERKSGESRKRPIRASELERMQIPYFSMKKQEEFARFLKKIRQIQRLLDREIAYAWNVFQGVARQSLEMPKEFEGKNVNLADDGSSVDTWNRGEENPIAAEEETDNSVAAARLILAVLCGWVPKDERKIPYCQKRQQIFGKAQQYFHPVALSFVTKQGQEEYLLVRDFLTYHAQSLCQTWTDPLACLKKMRKEDKIIDAHLAFQGETEIATEAVWNDDMVKEMAREGLLLLTLYSGFEDYEGLWNHRK